MTVFRKLSDTKNIFRYVRNLMTCHLTLFLAYFLSHFYLVLIQNRGVLEQLSMVFGTFCNVLYLSYVILVFLET